MQLFSEDYLMHYGVKGMKWKKHKVPEVKTPEEYLDEAYRDKVGSLEGTNNKKWTELRRMTEYNANLKGNSGDLARKRLKQLRDVQDTANTRRKYALKAARETAYLNNQARIEKQQRKQKIQNALHKTKMRTGRKLGIYKLSNEPKIIKRSKRR